MCACPETLKAYSNIDQITDNSDFRKGKPAAHRIYGPSETANRAYYRVTQILNETVQRFPNLAPFLLQNLEEILEGQDLSLIWRRDGLSSLSTSPDERVAAYRKMASLKTGALFRLLGQLVMEDKSMDETMTTLAYVQPYYKITLSMKADLRQMVLPAPERLQERLLVRVCQGQRCTGRRLAQPGALLSYYPGAGGPRRTLGSQCTRNQLTAQYPQGARSDPERKGAQCLLYRAQVRECLGPRLVGDLGTKRKDEPEESAGIVARVLVWLSGLLLYQVDITASWVWFCLIVPIRIQG